MAALGRRGLDPKRSDDALADHALDVCTRGGIDAGRMIPPSRKHRIVSALSSASCACILDNALNDTMLYTFCGYFCIVPVVSSSFMIGLPA
jgi:hypothetical protein